MNEAQTTAETHDPYLWLEDIQGSQALAWVETQNEKTRNALCGPDFERDREALRMMLAAPDKIPFITQRGDHLYNLWQDEKNPRGLWRRTTMDSYRAAATEWQTLLDIDALGRAEQEDWVWRGCVSLPNEHHRGIVMLSRGGSDACVLREFDLAACRFVADGFVLPEGKSDVAWLDADTLLVSSALGQGHATTSGYARTVRRWRRGMPFDETEVVFEGHDTDMAVAAGVDHEPGFERILYIRRIAFYEFQIFVLNAADKPLLIDVPSDAFSEIHREWLVLRLRSPWQPKDREFAADSVLAIRLDSFLDGARDFELLFEPGARRTVRGLAWAKSRLAISILDDMRSVVLLAEPGIDGWRIAPLAGLAPAQTVDVWCIGQDRTGTSEQFLLSMTGFLQPASLNLVELGGRPDRLKQAPARFDASGLVVTQHAAVAEDGARIPYFQIARADMPLDGTNATLLTGYGGFLLPVLPSYAAVHGKTWLERGGVYVVANIRGGGEFGSAWHRAGIRAGKKRSHDDFAVVARDLIARGVTRPERLGCSGGSNGGLLVGNMLTRFPQLFGAVWCTIPLLDMRRYAKLHAGASWIEEYGDPDNPEDWAFLKEMSPYHLVAAEESYPPILLWTSARDDRVHPGHARKMAAKLDALGHDVLFYEPQYGGHGVADFEQAAHMLALGFAFFRRTIGAGLDAMTTESRA